MTSMVIRWIGRYGAAYCATDFNSLGWTKTRRSISRYSRWTAARELGKPSKVLTSNHEKPSAADWYYIR